MSDSQQPFPEDFTTKLLIDAKQDRNYEFDKVDHIDSIFF